MTIITAADNLQATIRELVRGCIERHVDQEQLAVLRAAEESERETLHKQMIAASSTVEALMFSLRKGIEALARPEVLRRLAELDEQQLLDVAVRLQKFKPEIETAWTEEQIEILAAVRRKL